MKTDTPLHAFHYPLSVDKGLGRTREESDYARHACQMLIQVLFTNPGERVNRPDFGCGLRRMVFSNGGPAAAGLARITITQAIDKWMATVIEVEKIDVTAESEVLHIQIAYRLKIEPGIHYLNLEVFP